MVHFLIIWRYLKNIFWFISVVCCYLALKRGIELAAPTHSYTYTPYLSHTLRGEREREKDVGDGRLWRQEAERRGDVVKYTPAIGSSAWLLCISRRTLSCSISISADSAKLLFCHFCLIFFLSPVVDRTARMQVNTWARAERYNEKKCSIYQDVIIINWT